MSADQNLFSINSFRSSFDQKAQGQGQPGQADFLQCWLGWFLDITTVSWPAFETFPARQYLSTVAIEPLKTHYHLQSESLGQGKKIGGSKSFLLGKTTMKYALEYVDFYTLYIVGI